MECDYDQRRANTAAVRPDAEELSARVQKGRWEQEYAGGFLRRRIDERGLMGTHRACCLNSLNKSGTEAS